MSIALYDADFVRWGEEVPYNYSLMKYAAYYKKHHEIVKLITDLDRADKYTKLIYSQDTLDEFDRRALSHSNVTFSGLRFDGGVQKPLPPEVEKYVADTSIYPIFPKNTREANRKVSVLRDSINLMSYTSELPTGSKKIRTVFFHDYNIFSTPNWKDRINETIYVEGRKQPFSFSSHYPQYIPNGDSLIFLGMVPVSILFATFRMGIYTASLEEIEEYFRTSTRGLHKVLGFSVNNQKTYTDEELVDELIRVFYMNYFAIKYDKEMALYNKSICKDAFVDYFFDVMVYWSNCYREKVVHNSHREITTFYNYIYNNRNDDVITNLQKQKIRELFQRQPILKEFSQIEIRDFIKQGGVWPV